MDDSETLATTGIGHRKKAAKATSTKHQTKDMSSTDPTKHKG